MPLDEFASTISKLQSFDFGQELDKIVDDNKDQLPPMIREQLAAGKDGEQKPNTIFGRSGYSPKTVALKEANRQGLGAVTDRITNYDTGAFYESLQMKKDGQQLEADSDVPYFGDITLYSDDVLLDVDEPHRKEFAETVTMPAFKEVLLIKTGLIVSEK